MLLRQRQSRLQTRHGDAAQVVAMLDEELMAVFIRIQHSETAPPSVCFVLETRTPHADGKNDCNQPRQGLHAMQRQL